MVGTITNKIFSFGIPGIILVLAGMWYLGTHNMQDLDNKIIATTLIVLGVGLGTRALWFIMKSD